MPTVLARADIQLFNGFQGRDLLTKPTPRAIIVEEHRQRAMTGFDGPQRVRTFVTNRYRLSLREGEDWNKLCDLENDPNEVVNLFEERDYDEARSTVKETVFAV